MKRKRAIRSWRRSRGRRSIPFLFRTVSNISGPCYAGDKDFIAGPDFVMELDGWITGNIMYAKASQEEFYIMSHFFVE